MPTNEKVRNLDLRSTRVYTLSDKVKEQPSMLLTNTNLITNKKGNDRAVQLGKCYDLLGTNEYVAISDHDDFSFNYNPAGTLDETILFNGNDWYDAPQFDITNNFVIEMDFWFENNADGDQHHLLTMGEIGVGEECLFFLSIEHSSNPTIALRIRNDNGDDIEIWSDDLDVDGNPTSEDWNTVKVERSGDDLTMTLTNSSKASFVVTDTFHVSNVYSFNTCRLGTAGSTWWVGDASPYETLIEKTKIKNMSGGPYSFGTFYTDISQTIVAGHGDIVASIANDGGLGGDFEQSTASYRGIKSDTSNRMEEPFSITAWINPDDYTYFPIITKADTGWDSSGREWSLYFNDNPIFYLWDETNNENIGRIDSTNYTGQEGAWLHFTATYSGVGYSTGIKLYANGIRVDSGPADSGSYVGMSNTSKNIEMGSRDLSIHANGKIFDVRIHGKELTESEIWNVMKGASSRYEVGWWKCDEGAGVVAHDSSGRDHSGLIKNATLSTFHVTDSSLPYSFQNNVGFNIAKLYNSSTTTSTTSTSTTTTSTSTTSTSSSTTSSSTTSSSTSTTSTSSSTSTSTSTTSSSTTSTTTT